MVFSQHMLVHWIDKMHWPVVVQVVLVLAVVDACYMEVEDKDTATVADKAPSLERAEQLQFSCGDDFCWCDGNSADCSRHSDGLSLIPCLPENIRHLNFSSNRVTSISRDDFFRNVTEITTLDLSSNGLTEICFGAFDILSDLKVLFLQYSNFTFDRLLPVLSISSLRELDLQKCGLGTLPHYVFDKMSPVLEILTLDDNVLGEVDMNVFKPLSRLTVLSLSRCLISRTRVAFMGQLHTLNLAFNAISAFPQTCVDSVFKRKSLFPNLQQLHLEGNLLKSVTKEVCLPKLKFLDLAYNHFEILVTDSFSGQKFPQLNTLRLVRMAKRIKSIQANAFNNHMLCVLLLKNNRIFFQSEKLHKNSFAGLPQIKELQLTDNHFSGVDDERFKQLFGRLRTLEKLYINDAQINHIFPDIYNRFPNLTLLHLDENRISLIPDGVFDNLSRLKNLGLSGNQISVVRPSAFSAATRARLTFLDLSSNPFLCSCDVLWFQGWMADRPDLFEHSRWVYTCFNFPDTTVQQFFLAEQACLLSQGASILIIVSVSLVLLTMTAIFVVFRYRWHFRLLLYEAFRGRGDARRRRLATGRFDYDVFVSYDAHDLPWVRQHLMPELEGRLGLRLCIHERDFLIGRDIVDNIADSVERSKKIMMLFSTYFLQSQWCQFELSLCLRHVMDYDDALIIVCLDDVSSRDLTAPMMAVLKTTTYIQWMDDSDAISSFWGRLRVALLEILQHQNV